MVLRLPPKDVPQRHGLAQLVDFWHNTVGSERMRDGEANEFCVYWQSPAANTSARPNVSIPCHASATSRLFVIMRIVLVDRDTTTVGHLQAALGVRSLAEYEASAPSRQPVIPPGSGAYRLETGEAVEALSAVAFFRQAGLHLASCCPLTPSDKEAGVADALYDIGLGEDGTGEVSNRLCLEMGVWAARSALVIARYSAVRLVNGWIASNIPLGEYGDDYFGRALSARWVYGINQPEEAVYYVRLGVDPAGTYVIVFDEPPPVGAYWSITPYDADSHVLPDPRNPGEASTLCSLDSSVHTTPGGKIIIILRAEKPMLPYANWVPIPYSGTRRLNILPRFYDPWPALWPNETWKIPRMWRVPDGSLLAWLRLQRLLS
eukprot:scaffold231328_cov28-Tisochrysis_lutea.AAC.1